MPSVAVWPGLQHAVFDTPQGTSSQDDDDAPDTRDHTDTWDQHKQHLTPSTNSCPQVFSSYFLPAGIFLAWPRHKPTLGREPGRPLLLLAWSAAADPAAWPGGVPLVDGFFAPAA
ncbi:MAG: hypothetical protein M3036_04860, partial [Bifidobacteriales bacterium]|nr:hypothetical protein [Bifidobacteriales bacterium]